MQKILKIAAVVSVELAAAVNLRHLQTPAKSAAPAAPGTSSLVVQNATQPPPKQPCQCVATDPSWAAPTRTVPKCVFIDLGAADGNTYAKFEANGYGPVANCPSGDFEAFLVEANPRFNQPLKALEQSKAGKVHALSSTAAYDCEAQTSFYLDTTSVANNYWGSSMSDTHPDTQKSGLQKVTVPTINLNRLIYENTIQGDYVIVKVDIEGSEWDVVPCLAQSPALKTVDRVLLEEHPMNWQLGSTTRQQMDQSLAAIRAAGVDVPQYFSQTF
eukprot:TRINITY_DN2561_c0_g1_i1.p1 TRINITY_DN2561_c0_g1~~TRINITY_DN2561_c0_g1_i1.p1  ORF type:complete len:272 (+),score=75.97 TRINITY_DN2561_c0_g1_i1:79-894(+)